MGQRKSKETRGRLNKLEHVVELHCGSHLPEDKAEVKRIKADRFSKYHRANELFNSASGDLVPPAGCYKRMTFLAGKNITATSKVEDFPTGTIAEGLTVEDNVILGDSDVTYKIASAFSLLDSICLPHNVSWIAVSPKRDSLVIIPDGNKSSAIHYSASGIEKASGLSWVNEGTPYIALQKEESTFLYNKIKSIENCIGLGNRIRISVMSIEKDHPNVLDSLMHGNEDIEGKNENFKNMFQDLGVTIGKDDFFKVQVTWHLSTVLSKEEKRRHIGNSLFVILYKDHDMDWDPSTLSKLGKVNQIFFVVERYPSCEDVNYYRVHVIHRAELSMPAPYCPKEYIFNPWELREFILVKVYNTYLSLINSMQVFRYPRQVAIKTLVREFEELMGCLPAGCL